MTRKLNPPTPVIVRDALGRLLWKVAESEPERGRDFVVVWVRWDDGEDVSPWPLEHVWFADGEPVWQHSQIERVNSSDALTREQYREAKR